MRKRNLFPEIIYYGGRKILSLFLICVLFFFIGEIVFRLPISPKFITYDFDDELGPRLAPMQSGSMGLGNFSVISPPISINDDGFRGESIDWSRPIILALGSSELLGPGVTDNETWSARLTELMTNEIKNDPIVVNTGTGGYGSYHVSIVLRRFLEKHKKPELVIVRISIGDRLFFRLTPQELKQNHQSSRRNKLIKKYTKFAPFLFKKILAQMYVIKRLFVRNPQDKVLSYRYEQTVAAEEMWENHKEYWERTASLCLENNIQLLFYIHNPYNTPSEHTLFNKFQHRFRGNSLVNVFMLGHKPFNLFDQDISTRRKEYKEIYTLSYDPHANAAQHEIIARVLFEYITNMYSFTFSPKLSSKKTPQIQ